MQSRKQDLRTRRGVKRRRMFGLQMQDVLVILIVALLLFGSTRLSEIGRGLGGALREFRQALSGDSEKVNETKEPKKE